MNTQTLESPAATATTISQPAPEDGRIVPHAGGNGDNVRASWRYSLDAIKLANKHCDPAAVKTLVDVFLFCIGEAKVRFQSFCSRVNYDATSVDQMFRGRYKPVEGVPQPIPAKFIKAAREFLELEGERVLGGRNEFVLTETAKKCWNACDIARESQTPVFVTGPSQLGKTWALKQYQRNNNHGRTVYVLIEAAGGMHGMIRGIAEALGISPKQNIEGLKKAIRNALDGDMVLILDEVHLLHYTYRIQSFFACIEVLRQFHEKTGCGLVLCGTELMDAVMEPGKDRELKQTLRRGVHQIRLCSQPTVNDVRAIAEHWGLTLPDRGVIECYKSHEEEPYELVRSLGKNNGLKAITERFRYAAKLAKKAGKKIAWSYFIQAHLIIEGERIAGDGGWK